MKQEQGNMTSYLYSLRRISAGQFTGNSRMGPFREPMSTSISLVSTGHLDLAPRTNRMLEAV